VFWYIKEAIDAYFDGRPFQVTVKAGCLIGKKTDQPVHVHVPAELPEVDLDETGFEEDIDTGLPLPPGKIAAGSVQMADPDELEVEEEDFEIDVESPAEQDLDAFIEGKKRPPHLDD
jgi:hypothetical protein